MGPGKSGKPAPPTTITEDSVYAGEKIIIFSDLVLVHGGLYEGMTAQRFWIDTGVAMAFTQLGFKVLAPDRVKGPRSWVEEASHLANEIDTIGSAHILAASNGCSTAARMAIATPNRVRSLLFCWPATAGDPQVDAFTRRNLVESGCSPQGAEALLSGGVLRGVTDAELSALTMPVGIMASDPPDLFHQRVTVDRLLLTIPNALELGSFPPPFAPGFPQALPNFCRAIERFIRLHVNLHD
jgi:pimeloyl-ACP methyl ester carboxylesterase